MRQFSWLLGVFGLLLLVGFGVYAGVVDKVDTPWAVGGGVGGFVTCAEQAMEILK